VRWAAYVARTREVINAYKIVDGNAEGKRRLERVSKIVLKK
jgi:hypothetical protein